MKQLEAGSAPRRWGEKPYRSLDYHIRSTFGEKLYKISLDAGMSCPNRDGTLGTGGCIFCSRGGSGDFAADRSLSVTEQIRTGKRQAAGSLRARAISPTFRPTPTPTPRRRRSAASSWKRQNTRISGLSPSPRGRTAWARKCWKCWRRCAGSDLCGWSWACRRSIPGPQPSSAGAMSSRL